VVKAYQCPMNACCLSISNCISIFSAFVKNSFYYNASSHASANRCSSSLGIVSYLASNFDRQA
jgi:hypothetical protein